MQGEVATGDVGQRIRWQQVGFRKIQKIGSGVVRIALERNLENARRQALHVGFRTASRGFGQLGASGPGSHMPCPLGQLQWVF